MFLFRSGPPVTDLDREWIEKSLHSLVDLFGKKSLQTVNLVLPTEDFFPDEWQSEQEAVEKLFGRVCSYMQVDRDRLELKTVHVQRRRMADLLPYGRESGSGAAGVYIEGQPDDKIRIGIKITDDFNVDSVIATLAHELSHVLLLGDKRITRDIEYMEGLTDLATIYWGFGIFLANAAFQYRQFDDGFKRGWSARRQGYLPEPVIGYALAYWTVLRNEDRPAWVKYLNKNVTVYFKQSQTYLRRRSK
jgi:hypothetical protein